MEERAWREYRDFESKAWSAEDGPEVAIIQRERIIVLENILKKCLQYIVPGSKVYQDTVALIGYEKEND